MSISTILGINRTQDGSVCILQGTDSIWAVTKERLTRKKHHWGALGDLELYAERFPFLRAGLDLVVEGYSSDKEMSRMPAYHAELDGFLKPKARILQVSHHLSHLYSSYFTSGASHAAAMVIDYQGSRVGNITEEFPNPSKVGSEHVEVASFYVCQGDTVKCLGKQVWDGDKEHPVGLGAFYQLLTRAIFLGQDGQEGKVMGLAPLGNAASLGLPCLDVRGYEVHIPEEWLQLLKDTSFFRYAGNDPKQFSRAADLAAAGQRCFEDALMKVAVRLKMETGEEILSYSGGCALNCSANGRIIQEKVFSHVHIPPAPGDGGSSIGCAIYGAKHGLGLAPSFRWTEHDYLGPLPPSLDLAAIPTGVGFQVKKPVDLENQVADLLVAQKVVALFGGPCEMGPRALGHRSILADPRHDEMRIWINDQIKGRERYRPLAPAVLEEYAADFFHVDRPLRFMQYAVAVRKDRMATIPAVTHADGSARIQTVPLGGDPVYRGIIEMFYQKSGVPVILNTSFNGKDEPIVETFQDALNCFMRTPIHALVAPPYLILKSCAVEDVNRPEA